MTTSVTPYQQFIHQTRYARWLETEKRRETWEETVDRYINFFKQERANTPELQALLDEAKQAILAMQVMPSMRALMTAGEALKRENIAGFNCSYIAINNKRAFAEALYILMCGTGVGFSCERQEVAKLPVVPESLQPSDDVIVVGDSKEGWAKAYAKLLSALYTGDIPQIDYSKLRPQGARLKTFGGRASGSKPLQKLFEFTINKFKHSLGKKLTSIDVHDIMCMVGEIVVVGGVRRSALISLSNLSDHRMRDAKSGQWWQDNPQRGLSNNSVAYTEKPSAEIFMEEWLALVKSKSGERGIFNRVAAQNQAAKYGRRNPNMPFGVNPCCLSGDTLVLTDYGHLPIIELVGKNTNVWNGNEFSTVVSFSVGIHPTLEITLSNGVSLKCTHNHKFVLRDTEKHTRLPSEKRVEAKDLVIGDKLFKYSMPVITAGEEYSTDAYSQGFYSGDGNTDLNYSWVYEPKYVCKSRLVGTFSEAHSSVSVARCTWKHGQLLSKSFVPVNGTLTYRLNWLAGLLDADGCVTSDKNGNGFQIASVDKDFLLNLRLMLTTLGVQAKVVNAHDAENRAMPDGKGGSKEYPCQAVHRLLIGNMDVWRLGKLGLKTERLEWHTDQPQRCASRYITVASVKSLEPEEHFCFDEPKNHTGTFNGIVTGQSEIILRDKQMCNLSEVIVRVDDDINTLSEKVRIATILGTFQASLTKFNFLSETWTKNTEEEALLGVSMTGIMDNLITSGQYHTGYLEQMLEHLRSIAVEVNKQVAELLGIKPSAAITCVKPSGTVSQLCDTASGIHARHNSHYIRTVRIDKKDPVYALLKHQGIPIEDDVMRPDSTAVVSFPQVAPQGCVTRNDMTALEQLELWLIYQRNWCEHKPSVTITVKEDEWVSVGAWVYEHFDEVSGISFLPHSDHTYQQAPYQDMTEESLNQWIKDNPSPVIDWSMLPMFEKEDETVSSQTLACVAGHCEI